MAFLLLYERPTRRGRVGARGTGMTFSDNPLRTGREQAALDGHVWVEREPDLRRYEVVG